MKENGMILFHETFVKEANSIFNAFTLLGFHAFSAGFSYVDSCI